MSHQSDTSLTSEEDNVPIPDIKNDSTFNCNVHVRQGRRLSIEDFFTFGFFELNDESQGRIFGVCDGHNGQTVAKFVADNLPHRIKDKIKCISFVDFKNEILIRNMCIDIFKEIDNEISQNYDADKVDWKGGTTVCCVMLCRNIGYTINLGDSRCIIMTDNFDVITATVDHRPDVELSRIVSQRGHIITKKCRNSLTKSIHRVTFLSTSVLQYIKQHTVSCDYSFVDETHTEDNKKIIISGYFDQDNNLTHRTPNSNIPLLHYCITYGAMGVSRALGDFDVGLLKKNPIRSDMPNILSDIPDIQQTIFPLGKTTIIYIASDGYWDALSTDYVTAFLKSHMNITALDNLAQRMTNDAIINGSDDNVSCLIATYMAYE